MAEGNAMCQACGVNTAELVCFCNFPLAMLCQSQCVQKHKNQPGFHFELPITSSSFPPKEHFPACQNWLFNLSRAQQALRKSLTSLEAFEAEIAAAFEYAVSQIETIKAEYLAAFQTLKTSVAGMVEAAIWETTAQALTCEPQFTQSLSEWVWRSADPANQGDF